MITTSTINIYLTAILIKGKQGTLPVFYPSFISLSLPAVT